MDIRYVRINLVGLEKLAHKVGTGWHIPRHEGRTHPAMGQPHAEALWALFKILGGTP